MKRVQFREKKPRIRPEVVLGGIVVLFILVMVCFWHIVRGHKGKKAAVSQKFEIGLRNDIFTPNDLTVPVGATVWWVDLEGRHQIEPDDESYESPILFPGNRYAHTFKYFGTYHYHCFIHGDRGGVGMAGVIHVVPPSLMQRP